MFGKLRNYKKKDFYNGNENFTITTLNNTYEYEIFSYYDISEESDIYTIWYTPDDEFATMISKMKQRSYYETNVEVSKDDQIVTLSTCSSEGNRFVIHAKKIKNN